MPHDGDIRLVGPPGTLPGEGTVEVWHNGAWGTVCDYGWNLLAATTVCRQLGFERAEKFYGGSQPYGRGSGTVWLSDVKCGAAMTRIDECVFTGWGVSSTFCNHNDDAGVQCIGVAPPFPPSPPPSPPHAPARPGDVRLVGGPSQLEGRLEIYHESIWGSICDDGWGEEETTAACSQVTEGVVREGSRRLASKYGPGPGGKYTGKIWLDSIHCPAGASTLFDCVTEHWGSSDCNHEEDSAAVRVALDGRPVRVAPRA